jgi:hypothetical protein
MKSWVGLVAVSYCAVCCAQTPPALKSVVGEITSIDAASKQIKLKGDDGAAYTIILGDATSFLRVAPGEKDLKKATKIAFADVMVGDRALALEKDSTVAARAVVIMTKGDLAQKHERDRAEWQRRGIAGSVTAVNPESKEVTVVTRGRDAKTITVDASAATLERYSPDSVKFADAKLSSFADIQPGDTVRVLGDKNEDGTRVKAEELVSGAFETIAGTVDSVDPATGEVRITNLQTKKPVVVRTNQNSLLRRLDPQIAAMLARRLRPASSSGDAASAAGGGRRPSGENAAPPGGPAGAGGAGGAGQGGSGGFRGGFGGAGGGAGGLGGAAGGDLQQILERMPQLSLSELKKGDAVIVSSSKGPDPSSVTAFSFVAGVEPFLAAAPRTAGQVNLGSWNLDVGGGGPEE